MIARDRLEQLKAKFGPAIQRADLPSDDRLFVYVDPAAVKGDLPATSSAISMPAT